METERITIRLPAPMVSTMDTLVDLGQYATRTEVLRAALRLFFEQEGGRSHKVIEAEKGMMELQKLAAEKERLRKELENLLGQI
jgi:Arc/MetJ-type ribon-helix-helix transcriptional regulator